MLNEMGPLIPLQNTNGDFKEGGDGESGLETGEVNPGRINFSQKMLNR